MAPHLEVAAMPKARLIITAVLVEGRTKSEVARDYTSRATGSPQCLEFGVWQCAPESIEQVRRSGLDWIRPL